MRSLPVALSPCHPLPVWHAGFDADIAGRRAARPGRRSCRSGEQPRPHLAMLVLRHSCWVLSCCFAVLNMLPSHLNLAGSGFLPAHEARPCQHHQPTTSAGAAWPADQRARWRSCHVAGPHAAACHCGARRAQRRGVHSTRIRVAAHRHGGQLAAHVRSIAAVPCVGGQPGAGHIGAAAHRAAARRQAALPGTRRRHQAARRSRGRQCRRQHQRFCSQGGGGRCCWPGGPCPGCCCRLGTSSCQGGHPAGGVHCGAGGGWAAGAQQLDPSRATAHPAPQVEPARG